MGIRFQFVRPTTPILWAPHDTLWLKLFYIIGTLTKHHLTLAGVFLMGIHRTVLFFNQNYACTSPAIRSACSNYWKCCQDQRTHLPKSPFWVWEQPVAGEVSTQLWSAFPPQKSESRNCTAFFFWIGVVGAGLVFQ